MCESTEDSAWTITSLLHVIAFRGFINFRVELLLGTRVTVRTSVSLLAVTRLTPFLAVFHVRTWRRTVIPIPANKQNESIGGNLFRSQGSCAIVVAVWFYGVKSEKNHVPKILAKYAKINRCTCRTKLRITSAHL